MALFGVNFQDFLKLLADSSTAIIEEADSLSQQDILIFLTCFMVIHKELSSMAVPLVESLLENAVSTRIELRKASILKEVPEAIRALLLMDPLSKDHWGIVDSVLDKIKV